MGKLTTHVLDTVAGRPGAGIKVSLYRIDGERRLVRSAVTNADGRCDAPLLEGADLLRGVYELVFDVGAYHAQRGLAVADPPFLGEAVIRFGVAAPNEHYHVPLVMTPWSYFTYRGS
ncbi:MAG TPA: hydroxyisourate hydrolase [Burkholderiaceae bacterium]|nr:hydroxyisourate hydrolase [Burkholderiaceae bacterium]